MKSSIYSKLKADKTSESSKELIDPSDPIEKHYFLTPSSININHSGFGGASNLFAAIILATVAVGILPFSTAHADTLLVSGLIQPYNAGFGALNLENYTQFSLFDSEIYDATGSFVSLDAPGNSNIMGYMGQPTVGESSMLLWQQDLDKGTYSFDVTSDSFTITADTFLMQGAGVAYIPGFSDIVCDFSIAATFPQDGETYTSYQAKFDTVNQVPERAPTLLLLATGLLAMVLTGRKIGSKRLSSAIGGCKQLR